MDHQHHHHHHHIPVATTTTPATVGHHHAQHTLHSNHNHAFYFNFNKDVTVLFSGWLLNSRTGIFLVCIGAIILGILYQGIKHLRVYVHRNIPLIKQTAFTREHALQTLLYGLQIMCSYILMLIVMTFNVWVFICTLLGLGIGYFLCEWHRPKPGSCQHECSKPISRINTGISRLSACDVKNTTDQELEHLNDAHNQCGNCPGTESRL